MSKWPSVGRNARPFIRPNACFFNHRLNEISRNGYHLIFNHVPNCYTRESNFAICKIILRLCAEKYNLLSDIFDLVLFCVLCLTAVTKKVIFSPSTNRADNAVENWGDRIRAVPTASESDQKQCLRKLWRYQLLTNSEICSCKGRRGTFMREICSTLKRPGSRQGKGF